MAAKNGTNALAYVFTTGSPDTYSAIIRLTSWSLDESRDPIDITSKQDGDWVQKIMGRQSGSASLEMIYEPDDEVTTAGDTSFEELRTAKDAATLLTFRLLFEANASGADYYQFTAYVGSLSVSSPDNDKITATCSLEITGEITFGTIS